MNLYFNKAEGEHTTKLIVSTTVFQPISKIEDDYPIIQRNCSKKIAFDMTIRMGRIYCRLQLFLLSFGTVIQICYCYTQLQSNCKFITHNCKAICDFLIFSLFQYIFCTVAKNDVSQRTARTRMPRARIF